MNHTTTRFSFLVTFLFVGLLASPRLYAQNAWWALINGSPLPNAAPSYGQQGTSSQANTPGGRTGMPGWADKNGNFWIFGGMNFSLGLFDDLWEYIPKDSVWIWVSGNSGTGVNPGVYTGATSHPGGRTNAAGWVDQQGNFWIFGGDGYDVNGQVGSLSDLWKFTPGTTPGTGQWTYVSGYTTYNQHGIYTKATDAYAKQNRVGGRQYASGWSDASGNIWIFGGYGYDGASNTGPLNDLWEYNASAQLWYWVSGADTVNAVGVYGTRTTASANNVPGSRYGQNVIVDAQGNFWLFGGATSAGVTVAAPNNLTGQFNDLWEYNTNEKNWIWVAGSNQTNQPGVYGTKGVYTAGAAPGARFQGAFQMDVSGNFYVYGGYGLGSNFDGWAELSDYWVYNPVADKWAYLSGPQLAGPTPGNSVVGQEGQAAAGNLPSGRQAFANWVDQFGNLWIFGGGTGAPYQFGSDLWTIPMVGGTTLALQEVSLQGASQGKGNELNWQSVNEINMADFQVQRSTDGTNFTGIGSVTAEGNGNNSYSYYDAVLPAGVSNFYYRLKMVNDDSTYSWSSIIAVHDNAGSGGGAILYPNPAQNMSTLQLPANSSLLNTPAMLFDVSGRMIRQYLITGQQLQLDLTNIPQGVYVLKLSNGTALSLVKD